MDDNDMLEKIAQGAKAFQERVDRAKEEMKALRAEGESGGGWVRVVVSGDHRIVRVEIAEAAMADREMLQDLIASAVSDANRKLEEKIAEQMRDILPPGMPGMPGMPF